MRCLAAVSLITVMGTGNGWKTGGGEAFTEKQLKGLSIVTGKQENDSDFPYDNLTYADKTQPKYQMINGGEKAEEPGAPKRAGYTFGGWYYIDENGKETEWDFNKPVNGNMRLTAKWDPVPKEPSSEEKKPAEKKKIKTERKKKIPQKWKYREVKKERKIRVVRTGGAEYVVLCPEISREEFHSRVSALRRETEHNEELNISIGAVWDAGRRGVKEQVSYAEDLMYIEKQSYYKKTLNAEYNRRSAVAKKLLRDIEQGRFVVHLQPKVEIETGRIIGAEALVRKIQKDGSLIMPDAFIPIYELENVICHVDLYVLEEVCRILRQWEQTGSDSLTISVNLSRVTLMEKDIANRILNVCRKYDVDPSQICIEITESSSKIRLEELSRKAEEFIGAGFKISLDDYGTKYSNLAILSAIDFNEIKLDKSLIDGLEKNEKSQVLVRYVIQMCRTLNQMIPIAEGIETEGQINILKNLGCDFGQGYYFSKPISVKDFFNRYMEAEVKAN